MQVWIIKYYIIAAYLSFNSSFCLFTSSQISFFQNKLFHILKQLKKWRVLQSKRSFPYLKINLNMKLYLHYIFYIKYLRIFPRIPSVFIISEQINLPYIVNVMTKSQAICLRCIDSFYIWNVNYATNIKWFMNFFFVAKSANMG